ncbi:hypothetical protein [Mesobacillus subterraneus]|uniref:Uncharacterized protein n=1 Tax=Mesobacillus subterraneus TaxID=285983 RepID=A0A3R9G0S6_9BACI|nr:hypothetical protein [Mesobacillus subterraneus]RSD29592.1 hypothetical protein EJA10_00335 [Mesobacillus subterraneus]
MKREQEEPFLFDYKENKIAPENKEKVDKWLENAKLNDDTKIHSMDIDNKYIYVYAKRYSDVLVSYQRVLKKGKTNSVMKANLKKGNETDEIFVEVKYNPEFCCENTVIEDSYEGE